MSWIPENETFQGEIHSASLNYVLNTRREYLDDPEEFERLYAPGQTWLMGHVVPEFQRPVVWSEDQMIRFVESAAMGFNIGTWTYNEIGPGVTDLPGRNHSTSLWIIDGQQRLTALDRFFDDKFPVFGKFWSEVGRSERAVFLRQRHFPAYKTCITDEFELRRLYDRMNFGGTAHTEEQRALPVSRP
jgi:hypothetical protein